MPSSAINKPFTLYPIPCKEFRSIPLSFSVLFAACIAFSSVNLIAQTSAAKQWVGTWASAPYQAQTNTPPSALTNNTYRQIVRVSIGGDTVRVKFSNITCATGVKINSANIALSPDGTKSPVDASTITPLTFSGNAAASINAKSEVYSDPVAFNLTPGMRLAITTYYGQCQSSSDMTFHYGSRTNSYLLTGDKTTSADFSGATAVERWYTISTVEVWAPLSSSAVAVHGNSITDGYGLSGGLQNRWTDAFSEKLLKNVSTAQVGVLNLGIGATNVTSASNGAQSGLDRYKHDILDQSGVRWIIIFYGVNDINGGASANSLTSAFAKFVTDGHARNMKVYGATITPFNGHSYYSAAHEQVRTAVNKWIRTPGNFDACIDFDKVVRDPSDTSRFLAAYKNDGLHPNAAGYKAMGESIDPNLFALDDLVINGKVPKGNADGALFSNYVNGAAMITFEIPHETFVSLKVYSILGKEIAELAGKKFSSGRHTVEFNGRNLAQGTYVYSIRAGKFSASRKLVFPFR
jgi:lysophospholipase L1-like esterase